MWSTAFPMKIPPSSAFRMPLASVRVRFALSPSATLENRPLSLRSPLLFRSPAPDAMIFSLTLSETALSLEAANRLPMATASAPRFR